MTRETRIGLLVALAFIIMFGLVLGELTDKPSSALGQKDEPAYPGQSSIPLIDLPEPVGDVSDAAAVEIASAPSVSDLPAIGDGAVSLPPAPRELMAVTPEPAVRQAPAPSARRTHTVRANDNLIRIARRYYGRSRGDEYRRIFEANRDKLRTPSIVREGQVLVIPPLPGGAPQPAGGARRMPPGVGEMDIDQLQEHFSHQPVQSGRRTYTVRPGDNLTIIAAEMLDEPTGKGAGRIFQANRDKLSDPDHVPVGTVLMIPS